jgi:hypothetical protein
VAVRALAGSGRVYMPAGQEEWIKYIRFLRMRTYFITEDWSNLRAALLPNANMLDGISVVNNFDPLQPGRFTAWLEMLAGANPQVRQQMLGLMQIGVVETLARRQPYGLRFVPVPGDYDHSIYWYNCAWLAADPQQARHWIESGEVDLNKFIILEGLDSLPADDCLPMDCTQECSNPSLVDVVSNDPSGRELVVIARAPGWILFPDVWYPGWRASLDGQPVALLHGDYLFRAVRVPEGGHRILVSYQPDSVYLGAVISVAALLAILLWLWLRRHTAAVKSRLN